MKKFIEIKEVYPVPGLEYNADQYPGNGLYEVKTDGSGFKGQFFFVENGLLYCLGTISEITELPESSAGLGENLVLKMLAVSQKPELIKDLI